MYIYRFEYNSINIFNFLMHVFKGKQDYGV